MPNPIDKQKNNLYRFVTNTNKHPHYGDLLYINKKKLSYDKIYNNPLWIHDDSNIPFEMERNVLRLQRNQH